MLSVHVENRRHDVKKRILQRWFQLNHAQALEQTREGYVTYAALHVLLLEALRSRLVYFRGCLSLARYVLTTLLSVLKCMSVRTVYRYILHRKCSFKSAPNFKWSKFNLMSQDIWETIWLIGQTTWIRTATSVKARLAIRCAAIITYPCRWKEDFEQWEVWLHVRQSMPNGV